MVRNRVVWLALVWPLLLGVSGEIRYQGKTVDQWTGELRVLDVDARRATVTSMAVVAPGAYAIVPVLGSALKDSDSQVRRLAIEALGVQSKRFKEAFPYLIEALRSDDPEVRFGAIRGLAPLDTTACDDRPVQLPCDAFLVFVSALETEPLATLRAQIAATVGAIRDYHLDDYGKGCLTSAEPTLIRSLKDAEPQVRRHTIATLGRQRSTAAVPALIDCATSDPYDDIRVLASLAMAEIQLVPGKTIPLLATAFGNRDASVRLRAVHLLRLSFSVCSDDSRYAGTAPADRETALSVLIRGLTDPAAEVRRETISGLYELGVAARPALPAVIAAIQEADLDVMAVRVLGRIGPEARVAVPQLAEVLRNERTRADAVKTLASLGSEAATEASSRLIEDLQSLERHEFTAAIVDGLIALGPEASAAAVPPLLERLTQSDDMWKRTAIANLGKLGPVAASAVPALIATLNNKDPRLRSEAAYSLGRIGPAARSASSALAVAREDPDEGVRNSARAAWVQVIGTDEKAMSALIQSMHEGDAVTRVKAAYSLHRTLSAPEDVLAVVVDGLKSDDMEVRSEAMNTLRGMRKDAVPAIPALMTCVTNRHCPGPWAADVIGEIGRATNVALPGLVEAVQDADAETRFVAISALRLVRNRDGAEPNLVIALQDDHANVRIAAALCLSEMGVPSSAVVSVLIEAIDGIHAGELKDWEYAAALRSISRMGPEVPGLETAMLRLLGHHDVVVRRISATALGSLAGHGNAVVPALLAALKDEDDAVREAAASSLGRLDDAAGPVESALAGALFESSPRVRAAAATALGRLGRATPNVIESLALAMKDPASDVRVAAVEALGSFGSSAISASGVLVAAALRDTSERVQMSAAPALWSVDPGGSVVAPALARSMSNQSTGSPAVRVLNLIGPAADGAVPSLVAMLGIPWQHVCSVAAGALGRIHRQPEVVVPALIERLDSESCRWASVSALRSFGAAAAPAIPKLVSLTTTVQLESFRTVANGTLRSLGPESVQAIPLLLNATLESSTARFAFEALSALDAEDPDVAERFVQALVDPRPEVRRNVGYVVGKARSLNPEVVPLLVRMLGDADWHVRYSAVHTLAYMGPAARAALPALVETQCERTVDSWEVAFALGNIRLTCEQPEELCSLARSQ